MADVDPRTERRRPVCPVCGAPIDRMQRSFGVVAAYPCTCWLTPLRADAVADLFRATLRERVSGTNKDESSLLPGTSGAEPRAETVGA